MRVLLGSALIAAFAAVATAAPAAAQQSHGGHGGHGGHAGHAAAAPAAPAAPADADADWKGDLPRHFEGITLTTEQRKAIVDLQRSYHERMDAVRDSAKAAGAAADSPEVQRRLGGLMAQEHEAFKALLDEAGRRRFDENMARMHGAGHGQGRAQDGGHGGHGGHGQGHGSGRPPAR